MVTMFRRSLELSDTDWGAERRQERAEAGVPRFRRSEVTSSDHFEKRKLGRIVSKLSLVRDRLEILEERDDDDDDDDMEREDSGVEMVMETKMSSILTKKVCQISNFKWILSIIKGGETSVGRRLFERQCSH